METRDQIARAAADALERAAAPAALVGFDGFIDSIIDVVDRRADMTPSGYARIPTIAAFAARCAAAAGKSTNIERVIRERRFGGNGPLLGGALARLGARVTYIGAVGENGGGQVHSIFRGFAALCRRVIPTGPPSATECLEFDDGKLMLNDTAAVQEVTWQRIVRAAGFEELRRIVDDAALLGIVNWSLLGGVPGIWRGLIRDVLAHVSRGTRRLFIDLSDPAKRSDADVREAMGLLKQLQGAGLLTMLGLNDPESERIARVVESPVSGRKDLMAAAIREKVGIDCVVLHWHRGAAAADAGGSAHFDAPYTTTPRLSTGAGDHFNAGFAMGRTIGLGLAESLALGCGVSGVYVRDAESPTRERVVAFLRALPEAER